MAYELHATFPVFSPNRTHYNILNISPSSTPAEITSAYEVTILSIANTADSKTTREETELAYQILSDPTTRSTYDESLRLALTPITSLEPHQNLPPGITTSPVVVSDGTGGAKFRGRKRSMTVISIPAAKRVAGDVLMANGLGDLVEGFVAKKSEKSEKGDGMEIDVAVEGGTGNAVGKENVRE